MRLFVAVLLLASGLVAQTPEKSDDRFVDLGGGRARLRVQLDVTELDVGSAARKPPANDRPFLLDWLRAELPARFAGVDSIEIVETHVRRDDGRNVLETRRREFELRGELEAVAKAGEWLSELIALRRVKIHVGVRFLERSRKDDERWEARVELLEAADASLLEEEILRSGATICARLDFELADLRGDRRRALEEMRYVRRYEVEKVTGGEVVVPQLGSVFEGTQGSAAGFLLPGARELALSLDLGIGVVSRPVPVREVMVAGEKRELLVPEVATRRWRNDRILLGPDVIALVVRGLPFPGSDAAEREPAKELLLAINVQIEPLPRSTLLGTVMGHDARQGLAFARIAENAAVHPGMRLGVVRNARLVGRVEVVEVLGSLMTLRPIEGEIARSDELR